MLRWITRLFLLLVVAIFAPGETSARTETRVWPPEVQSEKLASGFFGPEASILRQAAAMQAAKLQQENSGQDYDFASGCVLAAENAALRIAPYDDLVTVAGGQRHHLNQTAAFRDVIPRGQGMSVEMQGNILRDAGAPHTLAHRSMEGFWNTFRGTDVVPTNLQYTRALQQSLRASGMSEAQVQQAVRAAVRERVDFGLLGGMEVPRVPGPIRNIAQ